MRERLTRFYFNNVIGNPLETTIALHYLIFDGVLERHPNLKILAVHGGGFLGAYHGRIDHAWGARSDSHGDLPKPPTEYLKKVYFDSVVFTPAQLEALVKTFGADHVLMGTDYPFDMADYNPVEHVVVDRIRSARRRQSSSAATPSGCSDLAQAAPRTSPPPGAGIGTPSAAYSLSLLRSVRMEMPRMLEAWVRLPRQCLSVSRIRSRSTSATVRPTSERVTCSAAIAAWTTADRSARLIEPRRPLA